MNMHEFFKEVCDFLVFLALVLASVVSEIFKKMVRLCSPIRKSLSDDVILITGAASGIGRLMCVEFAKYSPTIIAWDIDEAGLKETARLVAENGRVLRTYLCDLRSRDSISETAQRVLTDVGCVTVLINNAGIVSGQLFLNLKPDDIENTFRINVLSHFYTIQAFLPSMITGDPTRSVDGNVCKGHIVNVASLAGVVPTVGFSDYCASKAADILMSQSLELELSEMGLQDRIFITQICPFLINTNMFEGCQPKFPWLFPIVDAEYCARRIVEAVRRNDRQVIITSRYKIFPLAKFLLPDRTLQLILKLSGVTPFVNQLQECRNLRRAATT